jgi:metal-dependent amidase/aminoacylase/carboxypeptidase family protein
MIEDGLFERFPVEAVFGLHNWPGIPVGEMVVMPGPVMAGTCAFEISVRGHGCHAAMPHQGVDSIVAGAQLVQALQTVVSRTLHPCDSAVVSVTQFHAGEAWNIIPRKSSCAAPSAVSSRGAGSRRACHRAPVQRHRGGERSADRRPLRSSLPADGQQCGRGEFCRRVAAEVFGSERVLTDVLPSMGAEDFAYMLREKPGCYVWLGNGPGTGGARCTTRITTSTTTTPRP